MILPFWLPPIQGFHLTSTSDALPEDPFLSSAGYYFTPRASYSSGVFHTGPSTPDPNLLPSCYRAAPVQEEQAQKLQDRRKAAGRALRLEATRLNSCQHAPNVSNDEGEKGKKEKKR